MTKAISRRKFLRVMALMHAAVAAHLLFPNALRVAAQDAPWDGQNQTEAQADTAAAASTVSVHYRPSIIYVEG
jgi:hypothetical protein